jgi:hypothetical protein
LEDDEVVQDDGDNITLSFLLLSSFVMLPLTSSPVPLSYHDFVMMTKMTARYLGMMAMTCANLLP